ncbi:TPA: hypothetical protein ACX6IK_004643 [Yersinia enterocolitica]|jgi:hypothetical protein|nr:hypothetical protein [Yersinia enterocolitica]
MGDKKIKGISYAKVKEKAFRNQDVLAAYQQAEQEHEGSTIISGKTSTNPDEDS